MTVFTLFCLVLVSIFLACSLPLSCGSHLTAKYSTPVSEAEFQRHKEDSTMIEFNCLSRHTVALTQIYTDPIASLSATCSFSDWRLQLLCLDVEDTVKSTLNSLVFSGPLLMEEKLMASIENSLNHVPEEVRVANKRLEFSKYSKTAAAKKSKADAQAVYLEWHNISAIFYGNLDFYNNVTETIKKNFYQNPINYTDYFCKSGIEFCSWKTPRNEMLLLISNSVVYLLMFGLIVLILLVL